jgi:serine/threonine protein kinase
MSNKQTCCAAERIELLLDGRLSSDEQSQFEDHLGTCATCRDHMLIKAAEPAVWEEASVYLRSDALDEESGGTALTQFSIPDESSCDEKPSALRITDYFDPTDDPRMLGRFDGYEIVGIVGFGGMGVVLKGFEHALDRYVAIKLLAPHLASSGAARARFAREARAAAAVLHENVVAIHRVATAKDLPYLVMPYVPGESLQKRLDEQGPIRTDEVLRIGMQIAAGLAAAHAQGLVHRDIKPANILLDKGVERVTITDFGLARAADDASLTRSGVISGTPLYMSPEQARGEPLDGRSDLFSLGSVLYTMCVGRPPFRAQTMFGVLQRISEAAPTEIRHLSPSTPKWLCEIIAKLQAKDPADRFQSAAAVAELLGRWLAHVQQPTVVPAPRRSLRSIPRRKFRRIAAATAAAIVIAGLGAGVAAWQMWPPREVKTNNENVGRPTATAGAPATNEADGFIQATLDERALQDRCEMARKRSMEIEDAWRTPAARGDDNQWQTTVSNLHKQLVDLSQQIDRTLQ